MASKVIFTAVAVVGIAAASGAAWWYQSKPMGPKEVSAAGASGSSPAASPAGASSAPRAAGVEVAKAERAALRDDAQSVGSLRSRQSVMMRPEVAGRVRELGFSDGAPVRRGQMLVQLDDTLQRAEIKQAQAQVSIAQANFRRNQELVAQSFIAQRVLEESSANLQVAEAQLALACARQARMAIVAPFDGTVGIRNVNLGDYVKDGADLINLEDISSMYVDFRLPERFQNKLRPRQTVELLLDSFPGRVFKATVEAIDPLLDVNGRSVGVRAVLPNTMGEALVQGGARPGGPGGPGGPGASPGATGRPTAGAASAARPGGTPPAASAARSGPPSRPGRAAAEPVAGSDARPVAGRGSGDAAGCPGPLEGVVASGPRPGASGSAAEPGGRPAAAAVGGGAGAGRPSAGGARGGGNPAPLRPGMFARVTTVFAIKDAAIVVPEEAIVPQGGRQFVIKVVEPAPGAVLATPDTKLVSARQEVKLGARQLGKVEILEGLAEGETVVVAGQQRLQRDGTSLRIVDLSRPPVPGASAAAPARAGASASAAAPSP